MRWCWVNFQCRGVLLNWSRVGQGPTALAVGAGGGCLDIFSLVFQFSFLSPSLWKTARYRLKYCLKGPLSPKQPTNQPTILFLHLWGWSGGAKVLGKLSVPGRPTSMDYSRTRAYCACSRGGWGFVWSFHSRLSFSPVYRLKYCFKGPLSPKQPTNAQ